MLRMPTPQKIQGMLSVIEHHSLRDNNIFSAMKKIPRHYFVPSEFRSIAYDDHPLPIGSEQTISQPFTVAFMLHHAELKKSLSVLEIGTGSGWSSALTALLVRPGKVLSLELIKDLSNLAKSNIKSLEKTENIKLTNLKILHQDGSTPLKQKFDRIIFTAACPKIHSHFTSQLKNNGILIAPLGGFFSQRMIKIKKKNSNPEQQTLGFFSFVPLKGKFGF